MKKDQKEVVRILNSILEHTKELENVRSRQNFLQNVIDMEVASLIGNTSDIEYMIGLIKPEEVKRISITSLMQKARSE